MEKENAVCLHNGVLFSHKKWNFVICGKMDGSVNCVEKNKPEWERQMSHVLSIMWYLICGKWQENRRETIIRQGIIKLCVCTNPPKSNPLIYITNMH